MGLQVAMGLAMCVILVPSCVHALQSYVLTLNTSGTPVAVVDSHFMGVNVDTGSLYHGMTWSDPVYRTMAAAFAPSQLRIGGGAADALLYVPEGSYGPGPNVFSYGLNGQV